MKINNGQLTNSTREMIPNSLYLRAAVIDRSSISSAAGVAFLHLAEVSLEKEIMMFSNQFSGLKLVN